MALDKEMMLQLHALGVGMYVTPITQECDKTEKTSGSKQHDAIGGYDPHGTTGEW